MSLYEVLVVAALACVAGFAWFLYRKDTRGAPDGAAPRPPNQGERMFSRTPPKRGAGED